MTLTPVKVGTATMLSPDGGDFCQIYRSGEWYEQDLLDAIRALKRGGTFVDVGAGIGNHTVYFATECGAERVVSFEPYPGDFAILEENVTLNGLTGVVTAYNALIHPAWSFATLGPPAGLAALPEVWDYATQPTLTEGGDTECFALDDILAGCPRVDVIKIDVEDQAPAVLRSGLWTIELHRPLVVIEAEPSEQDEVTAILTGLDYVCLGVYCATPTFIWKSK